MRALCRDGGRHIFTNSKNLFARGHALCCATGAPVPPPFVVEARLLTQQSVSIGAEPPSESTPPLSRLCAARCSQQGDELANARLHLTNACKFRLLAGLQRIFESLRPAAMQPPRYYCAPPSSLVSSRFGSSGELDSHTAPSRTSPLMRGRQQ